MISSDVWTISGAASELLKAKAGETAIAYAAVVETDGEEVVTSTKAKQKRRRKAE